VVLVFAVLPTCAEEPAVPVLWGMRGVPEPLPPSMPFVDRFGQYLHREWPGKLRDEDELQTRRREEESQLDARPRSARSDPYGGWVDGPQREATGWFRTEQIDGRWWFITPTGRLFYSLGVDCVGTWESTFVEGRRHWFAWLPKPEDAIFGAIFGSVSGAHSMAETIGGTGQTFSFYSANLARKYGTAWPEQWRRNAYRRLDAWGFNTVGNWAQADVLAHSPLPYVASTAIHGVPEIAGAEGYWARMMDVYDPAFAVRAEEAVRAVTQQHRERPLCLGYFVDNELAWEGVSRGALRSPASQPARVALIAQLQARYPDIGALNQSWGTAFGGWDEVALPAAENDALKQDLDAYLYTFAQRYFRTVAEALDKHAPKQLYLGCRFAATPPPAVRACAEFADVASFNYYKTLLTLDDFAAMAPSNKPAIIGEFQFGALDRGLFHAGLGATTTQAERAAAYVAYVQSAIDNPLVIGTHWFQYIDEPITGRCFDGENYNIGFVDVTDTPYPEMVEAATAIHREVYERRSASVVAAQAAGL